VDALGEAARLLEGELGLKVAVGAGGAKDQDARSGHADFQLFGGGFRLTRTFPLR
jgi:hypothetical protein